MALRLIQFLVPEESSDALQEALGELDTIRFWQVATHDESALLCVLAEAEHAESIIEKVEGMSFGCKNFRAILLEVKATSPALETDKEKEKEAKAKNGGEKPSPERVASLELMEKLSEGTEISRNYILTVLFSVIVATVGLARDNTAIIIGAMVIAPLLTPNMALSLATTLGDGKLAQRALKANLLGILLALVLAAGVGLVIDVHPTDCKEIISRADIGYSDIILALAAGGAGALAFTSGVSAALVGVMVAVAILPPLAASGLLIGSGEMVMGTKAFLLAVANIICVNLSGAGMLLLQGVRPRFFWEAQRARRMMKWAVTLWITLLALLIAAIYLNQRFPFE
jgi:uncharacterized hydrophobic protein (TIGR00341 family)